MAARDADAAAGGRALTAAPLAGPVWVILPTYNERANLARVVHAALEVLGRVAPDAHRIVVVDDASPDGTGELADGLAAQLEAVEVLHRPGKAGLGQAYLAGFHRALDAGAQYVIEMDADLSHDPGDLARLLEAIGDADLVLGSRYVPGGTVHDWGPVRRAVSRGGSIYARALLGVGIRDLTGGFKCFRREVLEAVGLESVRSEGYAFQVELTYRALRLGFRVVEIPIAFRDRKAGESKMRPRIAMEAIGVVPRLRRDADRAGLPRG